MFFILITFTLSSESLDYILYYKNEVKGSAHIGLFTVKTQKMIFIFIAKYYYQHKRSHNSEFIVYYYL